MTLEKGETMSELKSVLYAAARLRREKQPFLLATVVAVRGSAYRRPGARMIVTEQGARAGSVSGGCLEADIAKRGFWQTREGGPVVVRYDASADDDTRARLGVGCDGIVDVLLERPDAASLADPLELLRTTQELQRRGAMVTVIESARKDIPVGARVCVVEGLPARSSLANAAFAEALETRAQATLARGTTESCTYDTTSGPVTVLAEIVLPFPRLFALGTGHDVNPVMEIAHVLGWDVIVHDTQARLAVRERFLGADQFLIGTLEEVKTEVNRSHRALALVMAHDYERDRAAVKMLLASRAGYIGVLGARRRTDRILHAICAGATPYDKRLHAPVGLELGAESPREIALSIIAEAQASLTRASGRALRELPGPIHAEARGA